MSSLGPKGPQVGVLPPQAQMFTCPVHCRMEGARAVLSVHSSPGKAFPLPQPLTPEFPEHSPQKGSDLAKATHSPVFSATHSAPCLAWC